MYDGALECLDTVCRIFFKRIPWAKHSFCTPDAFLDRRAFLFASDVRLYYEAWEHEQESRP